MLTYLHFILNIIFRFKSAIRAFISECVECVAISYSESFK